LSVLIFLLWVPGLNSGNPVKMAFQITHLNGADLGLGFSHV
jgi:hypothetical protein